MTQDPENLAASALSLRFPKRERLRYRTPVTRLFATGESVYAYPLRMIYRIFTDEEYAAMFRGSVPHDVAALQMMITVPKKKMRRAVDRVRLRRRIREAYRLGRIPLRTLVEQTAGKRVSLALVFVGSEDASFATIRKKADKLLAHLSQQFTKSICEEEKTEQ